MLKVSERNSISHSCHYKKALPLSWHWFNNGGQFLILSFNNWCSFLVLTNNLKRIFWQKSGHNMTGKKCSCWGESYWRYICKNIIWLHHSRAVWQVVSCVRVCTIAQPMWKMWGYWYVNVMNTLMLVQWVSVYINCHQRFWSKKKICYTFYYSMILSSWVHTDFFECSNSTLKINF